MVVVKRADGRLQPGSLTDTGSPDALSDLLAEGLAEGDLAFFEDAAKKLRDVNKDCRFWNWEHTIASSSGVHFLDIVVMFVVVSGVGQSRSLHEGAKNKRTLA